MKFMDNLMVKGAELSSEPQSTLLSANEVRERAKATELKEPNIKYGFAAILKEAALGTVESLQAAEEKEASEKAKQKAAVVPSPVLEDGEITPEVEEYDPFNPRLKPVIKRTQAPAPCSDAFIHFPHHIYHVIHGAKPVNCIHCDRYRPCAAHAPHISSSIIDICPHYYMRLRWAASDKENRLKTWTFSIRSSETSKPLKSATDGQTQCSKSLHRDCPNWTPTSNTQSELFDLVYPFAKKVVRHYDAKFIRCNIDVVEEEITKKLDWYLDLLKPVPERRLALIKREMEWFSAWRPSVEEEVERKRKRKRKEMKKAAAEKAKAEKAAAKKAVVEKAAAEKLAAEKAAAEKSAVSAVKEKRKRDDEEEVCEVAHKAKKVKASKDAAGDKAQTKPKPKRE